METKIAEEQWTQWLSHPITKIFFSYIEDYASAQADALRNMLLTGAFIDKELLDKTSILCGTLNDIVNLEPNDINSFYNKGENKDE